MRPLTAEEIEQFASREDVRRIAVENFLMTVSNNNDVETALMNVHRDGKMYRWNNATLQAITEGIVLAGRMS